MAIRQRSISLPIVLASISVALSIALLVGWTLLLARYIDLTREVGAGVSYMVLGIISFVSIMVIMILIAVFLVREILDSRKQIRFIDSVTHELKSPLASMRLSAETLSSRKVSDDQRDKLQDMILDDIDRLSLFIEDILHAGRLEMKSEPLDRQRIDLAEFCRENATPILRRYGMSWDQFHIRVPDDLVLYTDRAILLTVFNNLVDNACKYSEKPRRVRLTADRISKGRVQIRVEDEGIGIAPKELKRVKRRFYRVPDEDVRTRHGSGLGLYVVNGYARRLGGSMEISSPGRGKGTTVKVVLPIGDKPEQKSGKQEAHD
jgi:signal transduction histidine kinase